MGATVTIYNDFFLKNNYQQYDKNKTAPKNVQKNYKESEELFSDVELDAQIFKGIINSAEFAQLESNTKNLDFVNFIKSHYKTSLNLLLINAASANRRLDVQNYEQELNGLHSTKIALPKKNSKTPSFYEECKSFIDSIIASLKKLSEFHPAHVIDFLSKFNVHRFIYTFLRISWKNFLLYLKTLGIINAQNKINGVYINISIMDYPTYIFNLLSVFIFLTKLTIDSFLTFIRHPFFPTEAEKVFTPFERMKIELKRRWPGMANDSVWATINALTNYCLYFGISIPIANWLLVGFLFFDVTVISILLIINSKQYAAKKEWINSQLGKIKQKKNDNLDVNNELMFVLMQKQIDYMHAYLLAKLFTIMLATFIFIASFTLSFTLASPIVVPIVFFICVIASAMILSSDNIASIFKARAERFHHSNLNADENLKNKRYQKEIAAYKATLKSMAEYTIIPMIIIGTFTLSWQAAIALTAAYIAFKIYQGIKANNIPSTADAEQTSNVNEINTPLLANENTNDLTI